MTRTLDVMLIESHQGAAAAAVRALEAAGHHVHRCTDGSAPAFPCYGITDPAQCPLARHVDVALVVRRQVSPRPTASEHGTTCALRAGVPLVEAGPTALDPYEPWLSARVDEDVVVTCEAASDKGLGELRREIMRLVGPILHGAGIPPHRAVCHLMPALTRLGVRFELPAAASPAVKQALAVRVLDAVRGAGRTYGPVHVSVHDCDQYRRPPPP